AGRPPSGWAGRSDPPECPGLAAVTRRMRRPARGPPGAPPAPKVSADAAARPDGASVERASVDPLDDRGDALAEADAHGLEPVTSAASLQLVQQRGHQAGAGAAERVAEGDGAAVDVHPLRVGLQ